MAGLDPAIHREAKGGREGRLFCEIFTTHGSADSFIKLQIINKLQKRSDFPLKKTS